MSDTNKTSSEDNKLKYTIGKVDKSKQVVYIRTLGKAVLNNQGENLGDVSAGAQVNILENIDLQYGQTTTPIPIHNKKATIDLSDFAKSATSLAGYGITDAMTSSETQEAISEAVSLETSNRENADISLQQQIDAITGSSDVRDIVGTYQELQDYNTSTLGNDDIVKVLNDNTHDNAISYYRWVITNEQGSWVYLGSLGPFFTKAECQETFVPKTRTINDKELSQNIFLSYSDVGAQAPLIQGDNITIKNNIISAEIPAVSPRFSINNGNKNAQGVMDILAYSGQTLSFKVDDGTTYEPLLATDGYSGIQFTKEELDTVSTASLNAATYNCFIPKTGNQPYLLNNVIFVQAEKPADTPTDTIPVMTSNTTPYGAITFENATTSDTVLGRTYLSFKQGTVPTGTPGWPNVPNTSSSQSSYIIYTYDESQQPQAGTYQFTYADAGSSVGGNRAKIYTIKVYTTDGNYTQVASRSGSVEGFSSSLFTTSLPIASIKIEVRGTGTSGVLGAFRLIQPAITAEGTLWINNGIEPLEVQSRDANAQWQPFYDVLTGTVTVNSSHNITAITNIGFNYFSTVNMHNISATAHEDIRGDIDTINTTLTSVNRTGTASYQGLTKLYTSAGTATDGTMTQNAINTALNNKTSKIIATNPVLTVSSGTVTWNITNTLNTADVIVGVVEVSTGAVKQVNREVSANTVTISFNADADVSAGVYKAIIIG